MADTEQRLVIPVDQAGESALAFAPAIGGWARLWAPDLPGIVRVRFGLADEGDALAIREVYVTLDQAASGGISSRSLRSLPLARLEAAVNQPQHREAVREIVGPPNQVALPFPEDVREPGADRPWWITQPVVTTSPSEAPRLKLDIPGGYGRPDSFYAEVAQRFAYLSATSTRPANELAEANEVPVTTVHGWVKEARRRGFLPPGHRGKTPIRKEPSE